MDVLVPLFEKENGYDLKPIYNGSGAAMALGAAGNADVLLVHSPAAEVTFMAQGNGGERLLVMHNDFIIVGPPSDPAGIKGMTSAVAALAKIAAAKVNFYSRGDNSGTDVAEKTLFKQAGVKVADLGAQMWVTVYAGFPVVSLITRRSWEEMGLAVGSEVIVTFKASSMHLIRHK